MTVQAGKQIANNAASGKVRNLVEIMVVSLGRLRTVVGVYPAVVETARLRFFVDRYFLVDVDDVVCARHRDDRVE